VFIRSAVYESHSLEAVSSNPRNSNRKAVTTEQYPGNKEPHTTECQGNRLKRLPRYLACEPAMVLCTADSSGTADKSDLTRHTNYQQQSAALRLKHTTTSLPLLQRTSKVLGQNTSAAQDGPPGAQ
jgi:hypothetical protein